MKPLSMYLFPIPCYLLLLKSKYLLRLSEHGELQPNGKDQLSHTYKTIDKILYIYISVLMLWDCTAAGKISDSTGGNNSTTFFTTFIKNLCISFRNRERGRNKGREEE
jgi:hypothetical protein